MIGVVGNGCQSLPPENTQVNYRLCTPREGEASMPTGECRARRFEV